MTGAKLDDMNEGDYILEYKAWGDSVKVTAVDPVTLLEVSVVCPINITKASMERLAIKKLEYLKDGKPKPIKHAYTKGKERNINDEVDIQS